MGTQSDLANNIKQIVADSPVVTPTNVEQAIKTRVFTFLKPPCADDGAAATDITETPVFVNSAGGTITIKSITYICGATGFTQSATVFSTMTINKRDAAGANSTLVATMKTDLVANGGVGTLTTGQQGAFTLTATIADRTVVNGGVLCYARTHTSTGTVMPAGAIVVTYTED